MNLRVTPLSPWILAVRRWSLPSGLTIQALQLTTKIGQEDGVPAALRETTCVHLLC